MMASIWEKAISILAGNLNSGPSYLITAVKKIPSIQIPIVSCPIESIILPENWKTKELNKEFLKYL